MTLSRRSPPRRGSIHTSQFRRCGEDSSNKITTGMPLSSSGVLLGMLITKGPELPQARLELLSVFISQSALALHKAILDKESSRTRELVKVDRWRRILLETVSHDFRTLFGFYRSSNVGPSRPRVQTKPNDLSTPSNTRSIQTDLRRWSSIS
ncbi:hypothetical protein SAMN02745225_00407 [Ferrithrix thermotolerans DSM 19514]|uniref:GAF domain-containing protein n=1 Tax=Ferrithrix thermotolerans DSM 19514 TaxID=1121881 RepID=A0A1M4SVT2_9ACTN|nr:hypothetical protein SAMN02745225_00407 [Ferrithrix thermotolerans DSM 19514]